MGMARGGGDGEDGGYGQDNSQQKCVQSFPAVTVWWRSTTCQTPSKHSNHQPRAARPDRRYSARVDGMGEGMRGRVGAGDACVRGGGGVTCVLTGVPHSIKDRMKATDLFADLRGRMCVRGRVGGAYLLTGLLSALCPWQQANNLTHSLDHRHVQHGVPAEVLSREVAVLAQPRHKRLKGWGWVV